MWHPSVLMRIILGVLGILAVLIGLVGWSLETEYGGGDARGDEMEILPDGTVQVYDIDEHQVDEEGHSLRALVFEGTQQEADVWMADQRQARSYLVPGLIIVLGVALLVGAVFPSRLRASSTASAGGDQ